MLGRKFFVLAVAFLIPALVGSYHYTFGQGRLLRSAADDILESLARYFGKGSAREAQEMIAKIGGRELAEEAAKRVAREVGEESLEQLSRLTARHGPDVLRAVRNAPNPGQVLRWLDEFGEDPLAIKAAQRLAAGQQGQRLYRLAEKHGSAALRAEAAYPGLALRVVEHLGDDGLRLTQKLNSQQLRILGPHVEDLAALPDQQRQGVLQLLYNDSKRMVEFIGRFVEKNPGATLFTVGATTSYLRIRRDFWVVLRLLSTSKEDPIWLKSREYLRLPCAPRASG